MDARALIPGRGLGGAGDSGAFFFFFNSPNGEIAPAESPEPMCVRRREMGWGPRGRGGALGSGDLGIPETPWIRARARGPLGLVNQGPGRKWASKTSVEFRKEGMGAL